MNRNSVTVDAIIPVYNGARYLAEAIASVLEQDYPVSGIIVVDDGSGDDSAEIAQKFPAVQVLQQQNRGPAAARNLGIRHSNSECLTFLDADDIWLPDRLGRQMSVLDSDKSPDMVFGGMEYFYSPELKPEDYPYNPDAQAHTQLTGALLICRKTFLRVGLFDEDLRFGEFIDWYARAKSVGLTEASVEGPVFLRRLHANNYTRRHPVDAKQDYLKLLRARLQESRSRESE